MELAVFDDLLGIAEISSVFLGFTVLVTVISPNKLNIARIMGIVIGASMGIVLCLLPILMRTITSDVNLIVQFSSVVWIVINLSATYAMFKFIPGMKDTFSEDMVGSILVWSLEVVMYLMLILCVLQLWSDFSVAFYFGAVITLLFQAIMMFVTLVLTLSQDQEVNA